MPVEFPFDFVRALFRPFPGTVNFVEELGFAVREVRGASVVGDGIASSASMMGDGGWSRDISAGAGVRGGEEVDSAATSGAGGGEADIMGITERILGLRVQPCSQLLTEVFWGWV